MMDFTLTNFEPLAVALAAILLAVYAIVTRQWVVLHRAALSLMLSAEKIMATEEGREKMEAVYIAVWQRIPKWLKRFVTEQTLREKLQKWYDLTKDMLGGDRTETA